jgi:hypothetical protein
MGSSGLERHEEALACGVHDCVGHLEVAGPKPSQNFEADIGAAAH